MDEFEFPVLEPPSSHLAEESQQNLSSSSSSSSSIQFPLRDELQLIPSGATDELPDELLDELIQETEPIRYESVNIGMMAPESVEEEKELPIGVTKELPIGVTKELSSYQRKMARLTPEQKEEILRRKREKRQNLTEEERAIVSAKRKEERQRLTETQLERMRERRRERRKLIPKPPKPPKPERRIRKKLEERMLTHPCVGRTDIEYNQDNVVTILYEGQIYCYTLQEMNEFYEIAKRIPINTELGITIPAYKFPYIEQFINLSDLPERLDTKQFTASLSSVRAVIKIDLNKRTTIVTEPIFEIEPS